jgi:hypothetical protein
VQAGLVTLQLCLALRPAQQLGRVHICGCVFKAGLRNKGAEQDKSLPERVKVSKLPRLACCVLGRQDPKPETFKAVLAQPRIRPENRPHRLARKGALLCHGSCTSRFTFTVRLLVCCDAGSCIVVEVSVDEAVTIRIVLLLAVSASNWLII